MPRNRQIVLFFIATACLAASSGVHESIFNNFLSDSFGLKANQRGWLEFPRELPGFLVVVMAGALSALTVTRLGLVACLTLAGGLAGMAIVGTQWAGMIAMMLVASAGMHLMQPVEASIATGLSESETRGKRMGQAGAIGTVGMIVGSGFVWLAFDRAKPWYPMGFLCAAGAALAAAVIYHRLQMPHLHQPRARFVARRQYSLYYVLELFAGARKQIFLTFGPWVLIKIYDRPAAYIAGLYVISNTSGIVVKPLVGWAIDRFGERAVLIADGLILAGVCLGYGFAGTLGAAAEAAGWTGDAAGLGLGIASACFILDHLLFSLSSARAVYVSRLADSPQDLTSTLSLGVSINHVSSMTIPAIAGAVWVGFGYQRLFVSAAVLALVTSALASRVPGRRSRSPESNEAGGRASRDLATAVHDAAAVSDDA